MSAIDSLASRSSEVAMVAAADAIRSRGITSPDFDALVSAIRSRAKDALSEAMADAKEALACNMGAAAEATWKASFRLAGIKAVADVYGEA